MVYPHSVGYTPHLFFYPADSLASSLNEECLRKTITPVLLTHNLEKLDAAGASLSPTQDSETLCQGSKMRLLRTRVPEYLLHVCFISSGIDRAPIASVTVALLLLSNSGHQSAS